MKLATLKNQARDGALYIVNQTLEYAVPAAPIVRTLQEALDDWAHVATELEKIQLNINKTRPDDAIAYQGAPWTAPLPRAFQWLDGSAYVNHVELVRRARGAELPESFWQDPLMYQGGSDDFIGPSDNIAVASEDFGIDLEGETAIITDDVPMGISPDNAGEHVKLLMLVNDVSLRNVIPAELAKGFGFLQGKPSTAFSPVAVTPDELGENWRNGTIDRPLTVFVNDELFGEPRCGIDMTFNFEQLIAHAAKTRRLRAGTIIGSGTISNYDRSNGSACIAERRMLETIEHGSPKTPFLHYGDQVRIEMFDTDRRSIFGAINQRVTQPPT